MQYSVLVHGLSYGHDNSSLRAFLEQLDPARTRRVAVVNRQTSDVEIAQLHERGVRGIRLDLYAEQAMRDVDKQREMLSHYARRVSPWGWSCSFLQLEPSHWESLATVIPALPINIVVDHQALMKAPSMLPDGVTVQQQEGMAAIVQLLKCGNFWVKLSAPYRCSDASPGYDDMRDVVRVLVDANPQCLIWGSDW